MVPEPSRNERFDWVTAEEELGNLRVYVLSSVIRGNCHLHTFSMYCLSAGRQVSAVGCV